LAGLLGSYFFQTLISNPVFAWLKLHGFLALTGVVGPLFLLAGEFVTVPSAGGYSLMKDSISSLAWAGMGWVQNLSFLATGLLIEAFAVGLLLNIKRAGGFKLGISLLALVGFGLLLTGAFRSDVPNIPATVDGVIHGVASNTMFVLLPLAVLLIAPSLRKNSHWRPLFFYSIGTATFVLVWFAAYGIFLPKEHNWYGLWERVLALDEVIWMEVMAIWLLRLFRQRVRKTRQLVIASISNEG
jgi:hypothetical protein